MTGCFVFFTEPSIKKQTYTAIFFRTKWFKYFFHDNNLGEKSTGHEFVLLLLSLLYYKDQL